MPERAVLSNIATYAFVGPAGTGKSQRAQLVASLFNADYIIDDGLVISKGSIVCGRSAKSERNQVSAIRRAIFQYEDHRNEVLNFFKNAAPCSVMVIATSLDMAGKIMTKLALPAPTRVIYIEEVATSDEIAKARRERFRKGQHVIPVSHVLVRKNFAGKLVGQLRVFWKSHDAHEGEKTIVRPPFSFYGDVHIEPRAVKQIVCFVATHTTQVAKVAAVDIAAEGENEVLSIGIKIAVTLGDKSFIKLADLVKERIAASVRYFTGLDIRNIDIMISEVLI